MLTRVLIYWVGLTLLVLLLAGPAVAGGWAVITLDEWPDPVIAGQPLSIGFVVRQHGQRPMAGLTPQVTAVHQGTGQSLTVTAPAGAETGHYRANLVLPRPGTWHWSIQAFSMDQPMPPLVVIAPANPVELGQTLFVAKGCLTCHSHQAIDLAGNISVNVGPDLTQPAFTPAYLRVWLKNPAAVKPETPMPNLGLKQAEIEALVAFLTHESTAALLD